MSNDPRSQREKDNADDDMNPYGVVRETEDELRVIEKNKPRFGEVQDKFKKSARGPASGILVRPTNLLILEGGITVIAGVGLIIYGLWPLVFTDAPPSDEEVAEQLQWIFFGFVAIAWGSLVCLGASRMGSLESYAWALVGAVLGILPFLAGIFALTALRDPRVRAGFEEVEGALDEDEEEDEPAEDEADDEEEDNDEDDERPAKGRRK